MNPIDTSLFTKLPPKLVLGISGGVDSCVLLDLLVREKKFSNNLQLVHINYHLRGEASQGDEQFVRELASQHGLPIEVHQVDRSEDQELQKRKLGTQAWARNIRQGIFGSWVEKGFTIALAHHQDDLVENALLRISKGQNLRKMAGMEVYHKGFWRPLLNTSKADIEAYSKQNAISFREDASNATTMYERNYVRHEILPRLTRLNPKAKQAVADFASSYQQQMTYFHELIQDKFSFSQGLDIDSLKACHPRIQEEVLAAYFAYLGHSFGSRTFLCELIEKIDKRYVKGDVEIKVQMNPNFYVLSQKGNLVVAPLNHDQKKTQHAHFQHSKTPRKKTSFITQ